MKPKKNRPENTGNWSHNNDFPIEEIWKTDNKLTQYIGLHLQKLYNYLIVCNLGLFILYIYLY